MNKKKAIEVANSIENITSSNHTRCGITVRDGAEVEFLGGNKHTNDGDDIISLVN